MQIVSQAESKMEMGTIKGYAEMWSYGNHKDLSPGSLPNVLDLH